MKLAKFIYKKTIYWGMVEEEKVTILKSPPFNGIKPSSKKVLLAECKLLAPANASKIILVGLNYRDHAKELKMNIPQEPIIFLKPATTLIGNKDAIKYPNSVKRLDYEAELALVIKKPAKKIKKEDAKNYILGYTCLNDITARDLQNKDGQWTRAKSFDTFCPLGPWVETEASTESLAIQLFLNNKIKQTSSTKNFIFKIPHLVAFISQIMTLLPGDVISTGTPSGIGKMNIGDKVMVKIEGIGELENKIVGDK
ncbi:MAG: fumarylacetoacetate hydrolase family protein [Candidatus Susulua stagnicola]|nr:fumarylacetoacetate hydrolase family protein [Candidatus Susulua stagnicola]